MNGRPISPNCCELSQEGVVELWLGVSGKARWVARKCDSSSNLRVNVKHCPFCGTELTQTHIPLEYDNGS